MGQLRSKAALPAAARLSQPVLPARGQGPTIAYAAGTAAAHVCRRTPLPRGTHHLDDRRYVGRWPVTTKEGVHILSARRVLYRCPHGRRGVAASSFLGRAQLLKHG